MEMAVSMVVLAAFSSCWSEDWIITDHRGGGPKTFYGRTVNFDGSELTSSGLPGVELRDLTVFAWTDSDRTRACELKCSPEESDTVVTLTRRN
ncbi:MAG: hypothetical protein DI536_18345 [Archangium gephyra]|uniref:Uncharacterized protein n=1 Tax=Archangium gephyra TaxID=48 RepID=A0A2W5T6F6_9BACT|nr:MAG: hypothetical protein DI536_18345 [Archangium gephyra]